MTITSKKYINRIKNVHEDSNHFVNLLGMSVVYTIEGRSVITVIGLKG